MKYVGGKTRLIKHIKPHLEKHISADSLYIEPFLGGANSFLKVDASYRIGLDVDRDLVQLHQYLQTQSVNGEELDLPYITRDLYQDCRENPDKYPPHLRAYVSICGSFQGKKWGGYAGIYSKGKIYRDYPSETLKEIRTCIPLYKASDLFLDMDYKTLVADPCYVIYCDPPYSGTTGYKSGSFDSDEFWGVVRQWSKICPVLVSELTYPDDFIPLWQKPRKQSLGLKNGSIKTESLVVMKGGVAHKQM